MEEVQIPEVQRKYKGYDNLKPHQFKPGQSGNPGGKPKGTVSLKEFAKRYIQELNDEEKIEFMAGLDKVDIWKLAEGNPDTKSEVTAKVTMADYLKSLDDEPIKRQIVADVTPVQDTKQEQGISDIQTQPSTTALPTPQVEQKYNPEEPAIGIHN